MLDMLLACLHHLLIFGIFGLLLAEFLLLKPGLNRAALMRISRIDMAYGMLAVAILVVGFCRAIFAAKGWLFYSHNGFFWAKIATFALISVVSIPSTITLARWRRSEIQIDDRAVKSVRRYLHIELALFVLLPVFAAAMARGYGQF
jgi:putative membrane protein